jgi:hypothetical protein
MPRGGKRPGAGRPHGAISKSTRAILEAVAAGGEMQLEYMLRVMRDPNASAARRGDMAGAAAPYLHPRIQTIEHSVNDDRQMFPVLHLTIEGDPNYGICTKSAACPRPEV